MVLSCLVRGEVYCLKEIRSYIFIGNPPSPDAARQRKTMGQRTLSRVEFFRRFRAMACDGDKVGVDVLAEAEHGGVEHRSSGRAALVALDVRLGGVVVRVA